MSFYPAKALFVIFCLAAVQAAAQLPAFTSVKATTGTRPHSGNALAVDSSGNSYVAGSFGFEGSPGTIDFGTTNLVGVGDTDGFVAKFNAAGTCQWARQIGGLYADDAYDIVMLANGTVLVTGEFTDTTAIGATNLVSNGGYDIFFAAFSPAGSLLWARAIGGTLDDFSVALAAGTDAVFTGSFSGDVDLGGGNVFSSPDDDALLFKLNSSGVIQWARSAGGPGLQLGSDVKIDAQGNVFWAGEFELEISFGATNLTSDGPNVFIAKYDANGNLLWTRKLGEGEAADLPRLALGADGRMLCSAVYFGPYAIAGEALPEGLDDVLLASFGPAGDKQWVTTFGGPELDVCTDVLIDSVGNSYLLGYFRGVMPIGDTNLSSTGNSDLFIAYCSAAGQIQWARQAGGIGPEFAHSGAMASPSELRLIGSFSGTTTFGNISVSSSDGLPKAFLAIMTIAPQLRITSQPPQVLLSWPASFTNFVLESTLSLSSPSWFEITQARAVVNGEFVVTNQISNPLQFFRLSD